MSEGKLPFEPSNHSDEIGAQPTPIRVFVLATGDDPWAEIRSLKRQTELALAFRLLLAE